MRRKSSCVTLKMRTLKKLQIVSIVKRCTKKDRFYSKRLLVKSY